MLMRILNGVGTVVPSVLLAIVLIVIPVDVFLRTVLHVPFAAAHDIAIVAFAGVVWFGLIGLAAQAELIGVRYFIDKLPPRARLLAEGLAHILIIAVALAVIYSGILQIASSRFTTFLSIGWPKWIVTAGLVAAMGAVILIEITNVAQMVTRRRN